MKKDIRFQISLYITVPVIIAGFSALSILATYRLTRHYFERGLAPEWPVAFWGLSIVLTAFFCGLVVVKVLIDPVRKFVGRTRSLALMRNMPPSHELPDTGSDMHQYAQVFEQVTDLLGKVEARELFPDIVGQSKAMRAVLNQIVKVAPADTTVLLLGETGTGKELIADSIHAHSQRQSQPFVAINCAAIPAGLIESELFGYEKGAFTGADSKKPGKFETADGGTLFLDEIGDMPMETQAKLLRALEENQIVRVGGVRPIKIDVRFITATHQDLPWQVADGRFRQDLYYRLNGFVIKLPPLRERREDIPLLADYFLRRRHNGDRQIASTAMQMLTAYDWPGNVRELKNAVESAALMASSTIEPMHLPSVITQQAGLKSPQTSPSPMALPASDGLDGSLREFERKLIMDALNRCGGVQSQAARLLGIKERSLWHRLKKYDIVASDFKER